MKFREPVFPIPPFYDDSDRIDEDKIQKYISYLLDNGVNNFMTTVGTSQYNLLSEQDIWSLNQTVSRTLTDDATFICALPIERSTAAGCTAGHYDGTLEADAYLAVYPDRYYTGTEVRHFYHALSLYTDTPIMPHGLHIRNAIGGGYRDWDTELVKSLADMPHIIGMKEETTTLDLGRNLCEGVSKAYPNFQIIVAGGSQKRYEHMKRYGATTFLSGVGSIVPKHDLECSRAHEDLFFEVAMKMGWHLAMRNAIGYKLGFDPGRRSPFPKISPAQKKELEAAVDRL